MVLGENYFFGPAQPGVEFPELDVIHDAGRNFNRELLWPVIIGHFTEDDEGNLEYTYYEKYDTKGIG